MFKLLSPMDPFFMLFGQKTFMPIKNAKVHEGKLFNQITIDFILKEFQKVACRQIKRSFLIKLTKVLYLLISFTCVLKPNCL